MKVILTDKAKKQLKKLDSSISKRILDYLEQLELIDDPRSRGKALTSNLAGLWRYRVGDYRCFGYMRINWLSLSSKLPIAQQSIDKTSS